MADADAAVGGLSAMIIRMRRAAYDTHSSHLLLEPLASYIFSESKGNTPR